MPEWLLPGLLMVVLPPLVARLRSSALFGGAMLAIPVLSWLAFSTLTIGTELWWPAHGVVLVPLRLDGVSWLWATVFHAAAWLGTLYSLGDPRERITPVAGQMYAGAAVFAVCAGDLVSLFIGWELTGVFSVFLVWARGGGRAFAVGLRYLAWQVVSGVLLLAGVLWRANAGLSLELGPVSLDEAGSLLLLAAIGIKVCMPGVHTWLTRTYPEATPGGTVFLSAFTTKMAIYALMRLFAGLPILVPIGAAMTVVALVLALRSDDIRRILAYVLVNQLGFMVVAIGIGSDLALAGVSALAVVHILYKSLLFMATGAVVYRTGRSEASTLGGLGAVMPTTALLYLVGAWSHLPGLAGYASKSLITASAGAAHETVAWLVLEATTAAMVLVIGVHLPWQVFGRPRAEAIEGAAAAPGPMRAAMVLAALPLVGFGLMPTVLWDALPFTFDRAAYSPYNAHHALAILQLSAGAAFAYFGLVRFGAFHVTPEPAPLDADWFDRVALPAVGGRVWAWVDDAYRGVRDQILRLAEDTVARIARKTGPGSAAAATFTTRSGALSMAMLLTLYAVLFFTRGTLDPVPAHDAQDTHGAAHGEAHAAPAHGAPSHGADAHGAPSHGADAHGEPSHDAPHDAGPAEDHHDPAPAGHGGAGGHGGH